MKNQWNRSTRAVNRVHNPGSCVHGIGICSRPFNSRSRARITTREGVWLDLIFAIHLGTNSCGGLLLPSAPVKQRWRGNLHGRWLGRLYATL
jgi:hypothetical protein